MCTQRVQAEEEEEPFVEGMPKKVSQPQRAVGTRKNQEQGPRQALFGAEDGRGRWRQLPVMAEALSVCCPIQRRVVHKLAERTQQNGRKRIH